MRPEGGLSDVVLSITKMGYIQIAKELELRCSCSFANSARGWGVGEGFLLLPKQYHRSYGESVFDG